MEKSIETIWKQGFINPESLIAPELNNLYNKKSIHLVDKFKRMFKINLKAIFIGASLFLAASFVAGIPYMGVGFFITSIGIALVNKKLFKSLGSVKKSDDSYTYLKTFDHWMKEQVHVNKIMARCYYPLFFLSTVIGFWNFKHGKQLLGQTVISKIMQFNPETILVFDIPLIIILGVSLVSIVFAVLGGKIYYWDIKLVYGCVFNKLDEIIEDMETLKRKVN